MLQLPRLSWRVNGSDTITLLYSARYDKLSIEDTSTKCVFCFFLKLTTLILWTADKEGTPDRQRVPPTPLIPSQDFPGQGRSQIKDQGINATQEMCRARALVSVELVAWAPG